LDKRRVKKTLPVRYFLKIKLREVSFDNLAKYRMVRAAALNDHRSFGIPPPGTAGHLGDLLKCPFAGSEIREVQDPVCIHNAHYGHLVKIQAFDNHLGPD